MRIVGGRFRGTALAPVGKGDAGAHLRPTTDRVRESLFNLIMHGDYPDMEGARVLDLFAGTGALGFEALSRGAERVLFVDDGAAARALVRRNIDILRVIGATKLYRRDATRLGENRGAPYTLVFLDPPYGKGLGEKALASAVDGNWLSDDALVIWEESADITVPAGFHQRDRRRYGDTQITILQRGAA
ncbi:16S rRNA (guanine(966)-N(2))-methyltransferase RsmD [Oceanomicrobium pacificus]|uniref:16S rRNA (Guanine(966)-N(2))-methyltransferase RsmD n=1 Tax=Oceanomicrobium pacificus TaxID=2692916 RepID=A0A6B0TVA1_9RHOB|nr:16S rRNA (guanine(966)-N(2))-methyltransferase RsmD [Oceanomicrobium pacificus]MXU64893.1 16S rRNA (guanine(966)-N(2))-methyltransferase RsmD [Oceanomicrobium pacificus]